MSTGTKRFVATAIWILVVAGVIAIYALADLTFVQQDILAKIFFLVALAYGVITCFLFEEDDDEYRGGGIMILGVFAVLCGMYICEHF